MDKTARYDVRWFLLLHISLLFSSLSGVCSKLAAGQKFLSLRFFFYYGLVLVIMFGYAVIWQQILKRMPLTVAYSNKPISLIWGMVWGALIFKERITWKMILGAAIIFAGIYLVVTDDES
ncbi:EamA family transporter [Blautia liquoris]|uniref:EamA family transporter n=2 Tax=Blautia liquoris TaxID=2779518 RepID=A0A7M2RNH5_9FIRM|nr:EamA family transporter [Blautia liquoris]